MATVIYTIKDFENIGWSNNKVDDNTNDQFSLPKEIMDLITSLTEQVGSPNYIKTPAFSKGNGNGNGNDKHSYNRKKKRHDESIKSDDWESVRNFKKTEIIKKEGIQKDIDNIRLLINKLTDKTYDKIVEKMIETIDEIKDASSIDNEPDLSGCDGIEPNINTCVISHINKIGYAIFNMATSNKFNSGVYARLSCELQSRYEFMTDIINNNIGEFMKMFENMEFVSSTENYDKFCEMNIVNEKRRAMSLFLVNLFKNKVLSLDYIFENIQNIQNMIVNEESLVNVNKNMEIEELSENLYVILTNIPITTLNQHKQWSTIYDNIVRVSKIDTKINVGISSKSKFKHMDIVDKLKVKSRFGK